MNKTKIILVLSLGVLVMATMVSAERFCPGENMFEEELSVIRNTGVYGATMDLFEDGYHGIILENNVFWGDSYFAFYKEDNEIVWIRNNLCNQTDYMHRIQANTTELEQRYQGGTPLILVVYEGLQGIESLTVYQRLRLVINSYIYKEEIIAIKNRFSKWGLNENE